MNEKIAELVTDVANRIEDIYKESGLENPTLYTMPQRARLAGEIAIGSTLFRECGGIEFLSAINFGLAALIEQHQTFPTEDRRRYLGLWLGSEKLMDELMRHVTELQKDTNRRALEYFDVMVSEIERTMGAKSGG